MSNGTSSCPTVTLPFGLFSGEPTIAPLDPADFPAADPPPLLEQFIADNAPTEATPLDGFDAVFAEAVGFVDAFDAALGALEGDLVDAFAEADTIDAAPVGDTVAGFTASLDPTSTAVDDLGTLLGTVKPPVFTGGGQGCLATLDFGSIPAARGSGSATSKTLTITLTNNTNHNIGLKNATITQTAGDNLWVLTGDTGAGTTLKPGQSFTISVTVTVYHQTPGVHSGTLTQFTDQPDPQPCVALTVTVT